MSDLHWKTAITKIAPNEVRLRGYRIDELMGRITFSQGIWAPQASVEGVRQELAAERDTLVYARQRTAAARRREQEQTEYVASFRRAVLDFLAFVPCYEEVAERLARLVTEHATQWAAPQWPAPAASRSSAAPRPR